MAKLRVGYILDDSEQTRFTWDSIQAGMNSDLYSVEALIIQKGPEPARGGPHRRRNVRKALESRLFTSIRDVESRRLQQDPTYRDYFARYPLDAFVGVNKVDVHPEVSPSGLVRRYRTADLDAIRALDLDILVRGGSGILRGEILHLCRFGIISFHHGDNDRYRGGPAAFWEVFDRQPATGFVIQRLTEELDGGDVILKGNVPTEARYMRNWLKLYLKANPFMHRTLEKIAATDRLPEAFPKTPYAHELYVRPTVGQQVRYLARTNRRKLPSGIRKKPARWGVAYQFVADWRAAVLRKSTVIENPPHRFLADPFVTASDGRVVVYVEDYDDRVGRGRISAYELSEAGHVELGSALEEEFHLSFPFVFKDQGQLYMCPETRQARDIRLYRCVEFPLRWELHRVLIADISAVDTCIFTRLGRYWMLTTVDSTLSDETASELHLFYADSIDAPEWKPHPRNPVIFDSASARNAGLIVDGEDVFRVHQTQDFGVYGAGMGVAKIIEVTTDTYREKPVCDIPARFFPGLKGAHTLTFDSGVLCVDFKRVSTKA